jgi:hypothetical protein
LALFFEKESSSDQRLLDKRGSTGWTLYSNSSDQLALELTDGSGYAVWVLTTALDLNTMYRVVVSADRNGYATCYVNGEAHTPVDISSKSGSLDSTSNLFMGSDAPSSGGLYFKGKMADFQLYNKAWTATDVKYDWEHPEKDVFDDFDRPEILGEEEVTNSVFNTDDTSSWSGYSDSFTFDTDHYNMQRTAADARVLKEMPNIVIGNTYIVSVEARRASGSGDILVGVTNAASSQTELTQFNLNSTYRVFEHTFIATSSTTHAVLWNPSAASDMDYKSYSCKEVIQYASTILPTDCKALYRLNEGAGDKVFNSAVILGEEEITNGTFEIGSELVGDKGFDYEDTIWTPYDEASIIEGVAYLPGSPGGAYVSQNIGTETGKLYQYTIVAKGTAGSGDLQIISDALVDTILDLPSTFTTYTGIFTADGATLILREGGPGRRSEGTRRCRKPARRRCPVNGRHGVYPQTLSM